MAIPALFPFFAAGSLLTDTGVTAALGRLCARPMWRLYGLPGRRSRRARPWADRRVSGRCTGRRRPLCPDGLTREQAERLLGFCNNTGPASLSSAYAAPGCSGRFRNGPDLDDIDIFAALLTGLAMTHPEQGAPPTARRAAVHRPPFSAALVRACERAAQTSIKVAAFITLFALFTALLGCLRRIIRLIRSREPLNPPPRTQRSR